MERKIIFYILSDDGKRTLRMLEYDTVGEFVLNDFDMNLVMLTLV